MFGVFQLDIELGTLGEKQPSQAPKQEKDMQVEMKSKIRVDPNIKFDKTKQLWELLEQFPNVFAWKKGKLGCCKMGEHIVDTQGFPPYRTTPSKLSFWEEVEVKIYIGALVTLAK